HPRLLRCRGQRRRVRGGRVDRAAGYLAALGVLDRFGGEQPTQGRRRETGSARRRAGVRAAGRTTTRRGLRTGLVSRLVGAGLILWPPRAGPSWAGRAAGSR